MRLLANDGAGTADLWQGLKQGLLAGAALLVLTLPPGTRDGASRGPLGQAGHAAASATEVIERRLDFGAESPSADVRRLATWVVAAADNGERPFAIIDKVQAQVFLFHPSGRLLAASPVLLGYARGDDSVPGIGQRPIALVRPSERTTPAGRYVAQPGRNALDQGVLWVDYDAAVSMHRIRASDPREQRAARLASPSPSVKRISYGCINLPPAFYDEHFWPAFGKRTSVVYILPEMKPLTAVFPALAAPAPGAAPA